MIKICIRAAEPKDKTARLEVKERREEGEEGEKRKGGGGGGGTSTMQKERCQLYT